MLLLTSKVAGSLGLAFHVDGFWTAVFGAIVISLVSMVVESLLPDAS
jgi:putative membrane protein